MRLLVSRTSAEERLVEVLNDGYRLRRSLWADYSEKQSTSTFNSDSDLQRYYGGANTWLNKTLQTLREIFPTEFEGNYFTSEESHNIVEYRGVDQKFGALYFRRLPDYIDRLKSILESNLGRYTDLPIQDRLFVEDIDSFIKVRDVNPAMVMHVLDKGFLNRTEDQIQIALEQILAVPFGFGA
jgi:hypothetical protein